MAALPATVTTSATVQAIYAYWEGRVEQPRAYLGASAIGRECERELWYGFRWCGTGAKFDGRMLRLFNRGHREEPVFIDELRGIGCDVRSHDPSTGEQFRFKAVAGHVGCGLDGVALRVPEAPKTWHLLEFKTHNAKSFAGVQRDGVAKAKPEHHDQVQLCMKLSALDRTLYLAVNKDTDELYSERIRFDETHADRLLTKAERIVYAPEPLPRLSEDAAFWKCRGCSYKATCHGDKLPPVSCRTCLHATPEPDGDGRWSCALAGREDSIPLDFAAKGCDRHLYIPALLARWGEVEDASADEGWVAYRAADGLAFRNGPKGDDSYTSHELAGATPALLRDPDLRYVRTQLGGTLMSDAQWARVVGEAA